MKLYCHKNVVLENTSKVLVTKGKTYEAQLDDIGDIRILNDQGDEHYFSTNNDEEDYRHWFTKEKPKAKPTVIRLPNGHKFVFNAPYTIYTDGKVNGKAKCNPAEEYKAEIGLQIALERYQESIAMRNFLSLLGRGSR